MGILVFTVLLALVSYCDSQFVVPVMDSVVIPSRGHPLNSFIGLTCGIIQSNFTATWTTPDGSPITASGARGRMTGPNGRLTVVNNAVPGYSDGTTLLIGQLSYLDSGNYTCSATANNVTNSATIQLSLLMTVTALASKRMGAFGWNVTLLCHLAGYIPPTSNLRWMKGDQELMATDNKYIFNFTDGNPDRSQTGGPSLSPAQFASLQIFDLQESDEGNYTCIVMGRDQSASAVIELQVTGGVQSSTPTSTANTTESSSQGRPFPIVPVAAVAGVLGLTVAILFILIILVALYKRKKNSTVTLDPPGFRNDLNENTAYESTSNGGAVRGGGLPKYAKIDKSSISPAPPLPARPSTNLSLSAGNSANSTCDMDHTPPGYETPVNITSSVEKSVTIDPYYDNPDDVKHLPLPNNPKKKRTYYDEVSLGDEDPFSKDGSHYRISSVPSPAAILSGSLHRNTVEPPCPDFSYPSYSEEQENEEHDYDQIYSEPLDPTMLRGHEYELESETNDVAIPYSAIYEDPQPLQDNTAPLRITENNVIEVKRLGMGQFGHVILAKTVHLSMKDLKFSETDTDLTKSILVAIKKLRTDADGCLMEAFEKEVKFMARLNHDNVIRLLGVCTMGESFIMMEYMENGDLNQFLQKQNLMPDTIAGLQENEVTPIILLYMGVQIASGMHYLGSQRFVHRDLATRNCLVGRDFIVKISDFGMSRSLYESAYYRVQGTLVLPIRWMACETFYGKFSVKSDAWAFGVCLWEIYTLGKADPYDNMLDEEVIADAIRGPDRKLLERPPNCPQDVYDIMLRCWVHEPSMRADFGEIYSRLFMIYTRQAL